MSRYPKHPPQHTHSHRTHTQLCVRVCEIVDRSCQFSTTVFHPSPSISCGCGCGCVCVQAEEKVAAGAAWHKACFTCGDGGATYGCNRSLVTYQYTPYGGCAPVAAARVFILLSFLVCGTLTHPCPVSYLYVCAPGLTPMYVQVAVLQRLLQQALQAERLREVREHTRREPCTPHKQPQ